MSEDKLDTIAQKVFERILTQIPENERPLNIFT